MYLRDDTSWILRYARRRPRTTKFIKPSGFSPFRKDKLKIYGKNLAFIGQIKFDS